MITLKQIYNDFEYIIDKEKNFEYLGKDILYTVEKLKNIDKLVFLVYFNNVIVGYLIIRKHEYNNKFQQYDIHSIYIEENFRKLNFAYKTIELFLSTLNNNIKHVITSDVYIKNISSQKLFLKLNFKKTLLYKN